MRRVALLVAALALLVPAGAGAQPPAGIARPTNENALSPFDLGAALYAGNCSTCHGIAGRGIYRRSGRGGGAHCRWACGGW
jgi:mono/diheme cytochrome c family protein